MAHRGIFLVTPISILLVHNTYRQAGGEDQVFKAEARLLREKGHRVVEYHRSNSELDCIPRLTAAVETIWSRRSVRELSRLIEETAPDVVHFHNTFLRVSPAAYHACFRHDTPVVQTLHNYRLTCPDANHFRNGRPCDDCLGLRFPWPAIIHRCYHHSAAQSAVVASMTTFHRGLGTWGHAVQRYIALSSFMRDWMIRGGYPADRLVVKPNFLPTDPGAGSRTEGYALNIGRLSAEKGISTLMQAWEDSDMPPLKIIGDGPLENFVQNKVEVQSTPAIEFLGRLAHDEVLAYMKKAKFLVFPSECFEGSPMVLLEATACALPILATRIGSIPEIVQHEKSGMLFPPGNVLALRKLAKWFDRNTVRRTEMGEFARKNYLLNYTAEKNYSELLEIYHQAINICENGRGPDDR